MKKVLLIIIVFAIAGVLWFFRILDTFENTPTSTRPYTVIIDVPEGVSCSKIAVILKEKGVIKNSFLFKVMAIMEKKTTILRAGEYEIRQNLTPYQIMELLIRGEARRQYITFPEGLNLDQIADRLESKGFINKKVFLSLARDREFIKYLGFNAPSLEGYLFPDTYAFTKRSGERFILRTMANRFKKALTPELEAEMASRRLTLHQALTLASLIEEESNLNDEKERVSAVFHNRLAKGMMLQCDPTVMYALKKYSSPLTRTDLRYNSPYNTYRYSGLPPGPISSPGIESIKAALNPARVGYLFFVADGIGGHIFSNTYSEHLLAVNRYREFQKANENANN